MSFAEIAFLVGPVGAVLVFPVAVALMLTRRYQRDWTQGLLLLLCPVLVVSWLGYWFLWTKELEYLNTYEPVPTAAAVAADLSLVVCAVAVAALVVATVTAVSDARLERRKSMSA